MNPLKELWELIKSWGIPEWTFLCSLFGLIVGVAKWIHDEVKQCEKGRLEINRYSSNEFDIVIRNTGKIIFYVESVFLTSSAAPNRALRLAFPPYQGQKIVPHSSTEVAFLVPTEMFSLIPGRSRIANLSHKYLIEKLAIVPGAKVDLLATAYLESGKRIHATLREVKLGTEYMSRQD